MTTSDVCRIKHINREAVRKVKTRMLDDGLILRTAGTFKVLGDSTRVKILYALFQSELCVCDLAALIGMTHSAVSHQLRVLRSSNLVKFRREGKIVYYSLDDEHVMKLIEMMAKHAKE